MVSIENVRFSLDEIEREDIFVCAIGYEERSTYLYDQVKKKVEPSGILVFGFSDYKEHKHANEAIQELKRNGKSACVITDYSDYKHVIDEITSFVNKHEQTKEKLRVHVDYSSMPRSWYCRIVRAMMDIEHRHRSFFWYVDGIYPSGYEEYPSAGIEAFSLYSGIPTLRMDKKRVHVLSLNYDTIRTRAIMSILDPESIIVCDAYNSCNREISESVQLVNSDIIAQAQLHTTIQIDDFSFMVSKLCELAYEYQPMGDVIFVPDGPKPLILAISLVPDLVKLEGVTCLHISRNIEHFNPVNVKPGKNVFGFSLEDK